MSVHPFPFSSVTSPVSSAQDDAPGEAAPVASPGATTRREVAVEMARMWVNDAEARRAYLLEQYAGSDDPWGLVCATELGMAAAHMKALLEAFQ